MLALVLAATALAGDVIVKETFTTPGQDANTVFQKTTLTKIGTVKGGDVVYEMRCATVSNTKTCSAYDDKGKLVSTSTSVTTTTDNSGFTATFPDTFTVKTVTYEVKK